MERRHFLKLTFGFFAGATALAGAAEAAPLPPVTPEGQGLAPRRGEAEPAIATQDDVDRLAPDQVRWRRHWGYRRRRFWGYRRRYWRRRHWGWRRRRYWGWPRPWGPRFGWPFPRFWRRSFWW